MTEASNIHPAIIGLLRQLPACGPWKKSEKEAFLLAFKSIIDCIFPDKLLGDALKEKK